MQCQKQTNFAMEMSLEQLERWTKYVSRKSRSDPDISCLLEGVSTEQVCVSLLEIHQLKSLHLYIVKSRQS